MNRKKDSELYGVIGLGRFGFALAETLANSGKEIIAVDKNERRIRDATAFTDNAFTVGDLSRESLQETGIQNCDTVLVCIGSAIDTSILTALIVMQLGVKHVIAKAISAEHGCVLEKMGVEVVYPERDMAVRTANKLVNPHLLDYISLDDDVEIMEITLSDSMEGRTVVELDLRAKFNLNIIAVEQEGKTNFSITPTLRLHATNRLIVVGKGSDMRRFEELMG